MARSIWHRWKALMTEETLDILSEGALLAALDHPEEFVGPNEPLFNICWRRVGGLFFIKVGRLTVSFSISRRYRPL
jgi:hypothetical protein